MNILFVCTMNKLRSLTAEHIYAQDSRFEVKSAGTDSYSDNPLRAEHLYWADYVIVMEKFHKIRIEQLFPNIFPKLNLLCLEIPDAYTYMQPELIDILKEKVEVIYKEITFR